MSALTDDLKLKAQAEIAKIQDAAVAEYLKVKASHFSPAVVAAAFVVGLILGFIV